MTAGSIFLNLLLIFNAKSHYFPKWNEGFLVVSPIPTALWEGGQHVPVCTARWPA